MCKLAVRAMLHCGAMYVIRVHKDGDGWLLAYRFITLKLFVEVLMI